MNAKLIPDVLNIIGASDRQMDTNYGIHRNVTGVCKSEWAGKLKKAQYDTLKYFLFSF